MKELYEKLSEIANELRRMTNTNPEPPRDVAENIDAAIVYLDCARQNIITANAYKVSPQVVKKA